MAFGMVGLAPERFWRMSWKEYELTLRGFFELERQRAERDQTNAKLISYYTISPYMKRKMSFQEFAGIRPHREVKPMTKEEIEYISKKMGRYIDKNGIFHN